MNIASLQTFPCKLDPRDRTELLRISFLAAGLSVFKPLFYSLDRSKIFRALVNLKSCLMSEEIPNLLSDCEFCGYAMARAERDLAHSHAGDVIV